MNSLTQLSTLENLSNVCVHMLSRIHGIFQARILEWVVIFLLQRIFPTQELNLHLLCLLHCRQILYPLNQWGVRMNTYTIAKLLTKLFCTCVPVSRIVAFVIAKYLKGSKGPFLADWLDKLWYIHRMESCPALFLMGYFFYVLIWRIPPISQ